MDNEKLPDDEKGTGPVAPENTLKDRAQDFLERRIALTPPEVVALSKNLRNYKSFSYARRILKRAAGDLTPDADPELMRKLVQQWALCTYKDDDLPIDQRLDEAERILGIFENIDTTMDQETLGLAGAIHKNRWKVDNQKIHLERSLSYYLRGYELGPERDQGYAGINAAFVLDWLAFIEENEAAQPVARERRKRANEIRRDILEKVAPLVNDPAYSDLKNLWWYYSTLAEAYFGLKRYEEAVEVLLRGKDAIGEVPEWEEESTIQQIARLAILHSPTDLAGKEFEGTAAWNALDRVFGERPGAVRSAFTGKIGLALSGGGFRASLFHIGTLARLAELDVLRHIEVLSCVSGGSIIGAFYYLKVKQLLETKEAPTKQDYIEIVKETVNEFLNAVQRNIRVRIASELTTNLKMALTRRFSRTIRVGELFEKSFFSGNGPDYGDGSAQLPLKSLKIVPKGEKANFNPKLHNWRRVSKVPVLILNATTLNTGHVWQFTATWMGEPPSSVATKVDMNDRLRRMYHDEAPKGHEAIGLGLAVAASACVPGLFEPVTFDGLYPGRTIGLVDGGVCDNQGVSSLLEQDCTVVLVSDGSGQMGSQASSSRGVLGVPLRSNSILQARIREAQHHDLEKRKRSSLLLGLMYIHLKRDLDGEEVDWVGCAETVERKKRIGNLTAYGIDRDIQTQLAAIRTDLDSFSDMEAYALMTSAYRMTEESFRDPRNVDGFTAGGEDPIDWKFLKAESAMKGVGREAQDLRKLLAVSCNLAFKVWKLVPALRYTAIASGAIAFILFVWLSYRYADSVLFPSVTVGVFAVFVLLTGAATWAASSNSVMAVSVVPVRGAVARLVFWIGMCLFGWWASRLHLFIFDRLYLYLGRLDTFQKERKR
jgi:predicted acylesterase/phospholipase RssA